MWVDGEQAVVVAAMLAFFAVNLLGQMFVFNQTSLGEYKAREGSVPTKAKDEIWREHEGVPVARPKESPIIARKREEYKGRTVTWAEVNKHSARDDLWIVCEGKVFDVTKFVERHPGGWRPIVHMSDRDATDVMNEFHPAAVFDKWMPNYYIADLADYKESELLADYRAIRQELLGRGFFRNSRSYYFAKYLWLASIFVPTLYGVLMCTSTFAHMLSAAGLALFWQQLAFVGHDLGHNSVSHVLELDYFWGSLIGDFLGGITLSWWKLSHNTHHCVCNSVEHDPDIQHLPVFAISEKLFGKFWSTFHQKYFVTDAIARLLVSYQHLLYVPIMMVARFNLYVQSTILLFTREKVAYRAYEIASIAGFWTWYTLFISCLPSWQEKVCYLLISHGLAGMLHIQITISHFSMDTFHGISEDDWIRHQMATTMNVDCAPYMDWFHGGLQFQLEHHLFPRLTRRNLRVARARVLELAAKHDLNYVEMDFPKAFERLHNTLYGTALQARKLKKGDAGFYHSPLWEGLNAQG
ncbi:Acyl-lipid (9-3)-desaturase (BoDes6) [Durusdinium trenchii]|uniref:Acyl-lipid (9-3)-desaturase (BoDes6) n=1 Tax=Durusdinium trenchii TaxID=1381693 RepID=A0ABP0QHA7_9DINO